MVSLSRNVKLSRVQAMMSFLGITDYVIASHGLPLPEVVAVSKAYRPEKVFRFFPDTNTMTYIGFGSGSVLQQRVELRGIKPHDTFINRMYFELKCQCNNAIREQQKRTYMPHLDKTLRAFNGLRFLTEK